MFVVGIAQGGKLGHQVLQIQRNLAVRPIAALVDAVLGDVFAFSCVHAEFGNDGKAHILQQPQLHRAGSKHRTDIAVAHILIENILPSERAKAYKMKMEAIKRQGARTDLTSPKISAKFRSDDEVGQDAGVSGDTIRNYIALTQLVPELQQMVDEKKIALSPAYQLAALTPKEQGLLLETIDSEQTTPSLSQAQRMKKLSQSGELNEDTMLSIMMEQKKPEKNDITLSGEKLRKYFPRSYTPFQIENTIFKLLDAWQKKRQRDQSR